MFATQQLATVDVLRLNAHPVDYLIVAIYFGCVLSVGWMARKRINSSLDFFLSGRSLPSWVTGIAFVSANLGAVEIMGMSANGAQYGMQTMQYFWVGAIPAMVFLGIVMMPFYYGSKVRSLPEFMLLRYGKGAHLINTISFALAQVLVAGVNLFLLGTIVRALLGWPLWLSVIISAIVVLSYIVVGGLSAAIYNEVLQFVVIVAALAPLTIVGLHRVGGWHGLTAKVASGPGGHAQLSPWPASDLSGIANPALSVIGVVFGLGFVMSFSYFTTNFVEVQRAMASDSLAAGRRTPIIGAFPKMFIPFIVVIPGMIAAVTIPAMQTLKSTGKSPEGITYNDTLLLMMKEYLPNGLLGIAISALIASFMAGMAANISAFNTVFSFDLWQRYVRGHRSDSYYLRIGRTAAIGATILAVGTAFIAARYNNLMDYLQQLFSFFNAPLFATFLLGVFVKRITPTASWIGMLCGICTSGAIFLSQELGLLGIPGQGASFIAAGAAFIVNVLVSVVVSCVTTPKPDAELVGFVYSLTPKALSDSDPSVPWHSKPTLWAGIALAITITLSVVFA